MVPAVVTFNTNITKPRTTEAGTASPQALSPLLLYSSSDDEHDDDNDSFSVSSVSSVSETESYVSSSHADERARFDVDEEWADESRGAEGDFDVHTDDDAEDAGVAGGDDGYDNEGYSSEDDDSSDDGFAIRGLRYLRPYIDSCPACAEWARGVAEAWKVSSRNRRILASSTWANPDVAAWTFT